MYVLNGYLYWLHKLHNLIDRYRNMTWLLAERFAKPVEFHGKTVFLFYNSRWSERISEVFDLNMLKCRFLFYVVGVSGKLSEKRHLDHLL